MKIGVIGAGHVGSACANACVLRSVGSQIVLVDQNRDLAKAQAEDIMHATPFSRSMLVKAGDYDDLDGCGIIIMTAGVSQKLGETRLDLLKRNAEVFHEVIPRIAASAPDAVLIIATNPVDVMTHLACDIAEEFNFSKGQIIGSGTVLDTARFRASLGKILNISSHSIHAYVLGEHGDSEVLHWSGASVANMPLLTFAAEVGSLITPSIKSMIDAEVRHAGARIMKGKGATWYGIGAGVARMAKAIIEDENAVVTCSMPHIDLFGLPKVTLSLPVILGARGAIFTIRPALDHQEEEALLRSGHILAEAARQIGCSQ